MPEELYKNDDGHETIKLVLCKHDYDDYELGEDELFLMILNMKWIGNIELVIPKVKRMKMKRMKVKRIWKGMKKSIFYKVTRSPTVPV